jgi:hypothetical protein
MKAYTNSKTLHTGHLAKSFGLRDAPTDIKTLLKDSAPKHADAPKNKVIAMPIALLRG